MELLKSWGSKFSAFFEKYNNFIFIITMTLFTILTVVGICVHEPWYDEANAWLIAQDLNFFEILKYMKYEGHMFVWYLAIMPFAKLHLQYPMPMLITNLVFMWGAVFILWKKAPIHPIWKILITFSTPVCYQYAVVARCYSVGILLLFTLCALFKDKLKHPYWYAVLIVLCANTNSLCLFGAAAFGGLFLFDYIKEYKDFFKRKEFYIIAMIAIFGIAIIGFQLLGAGHQADTLNLVHPLIPAKKFFWVMIANGFGILPIEQRTNIILGSFYILSAFISFYNNKKSLFFYITTFCGLSIIFLTLYNGYRWHHYFFYIYLIISLWIFNLENTSKKIYNYLVYLFLFVISINFLNVSYKLYKYDIKKPYSNSKLMANRILKTPEYKNSNIVICDALPLAVVPYLRNKKYNAYSCFSHKEAGFFDYANKIYARNGIDYIHPLNLTPENFKYFENKTIYLLAQMNNKANYSSDYYKLELESCSGLSGGDGKFCLIKMIPAY